MKKPFITVDGNEATALVAYATNEVIAIYPITPSSTMGELADAWAATDKPNIFGSIPQVTQMQSEGGAAGALHGALQGGALSTTFTASQGLLLMIPNMYKIAGELTPAVIHVAARALATHALSIFGDHSDVMSVRSTGFSMLCSASVQEAHDFSMVSQAATLRCRVPFLHFFDGFRTSHEVSKIQPLSQEDIKSLIDMPSVWAHRHRSLDPERPVLRGTAQNPDVFFQARESSNPYHSAVSQIVSQEMDRFAAKTGRRYQIFEYVGAADAEHVLVLMGSGIGAAEEAIEQLNKQGKKVGLIKVRLYRPFDVGRFIAALPQSTRRIAVLDRTKEPGAIGEPLYQDVLAALAEAWPSEGRHLPLVIGGRYGLGSKEFTPAMVMAVMEHLQSPSPKRHFTIGIHDDVSLTSLPWDECVFTEPNDVKRAVFYGLGSDGTVGANKNSVKIVGENTPLYAQGYFVYDSRKAGSVTTSHLRFSPRPIKSTYLIRESDFVACHQFELLKRMEVLETAREGAKFLLNSPFTADQVWPQLPQEVQASIIDKRLEFYVIDAARIARESQLGGRINTIMQTCFFALAEILPMEDAIERIRESIHKTYSKLGPLVVDRNLEAVRVAVESLQKVAVPTTAQGHLRRLLPVPSTAPDFVKRVTGMIIEGRGDLLPVSAFPVDGTFPTGTATFEKRNIAELIPIWDPDICIECGLCALVCPHAAIRTKRYDPMELERGPGDFPNRLSKQKNGEYQTALTIQVTPEDCTGCGVCVNVCPAKSKEIVKHKAIDMLPKSEHFEVEKARYDFFQSIPDIDRRLVDAATIKGSQLLLPLFEFSGACGGCGETPYLKLISQLFGDRMIVANATGCSSIYGGNLPTTPWSKDASGRGPAWCNSLFEDNAEFGLGIRFALDGKRARAEQLLQSLEKEVGRELAQELLSSSQDTEAAIAEQRERIRRLKLALEPLSGEIAQELILIADSLVDRSLWIVGGDGWAYDIDFGGLDHVLASGRDVNVLVLDTGVYSNTGGQASKATPRAATAKFAAQGREVHRKDLGMMAMAYGSVYVAQVAMGANPAQTLKAFHEAESYRGPSLILAYSHCVAHGIDMSNAMSHQKDLVKCGFWPLYRYDPRDARKGERPFHLDSHKPTLPFSEVAMKEARFAMLARAQPERAKYLFELAQRDINDTWHYYEQLAGLERELSDLASN
jgi:pyruvate-ferredoxin/flavodoxin oxidoreductase